MAPLVPNLRKQLEKAIVKAREVAERGAKKSLESLAVDHHEPHASMKPEQRKLRNRLRAHGRQLGDARNAQGGQEVRRLLREVAYEHWHRMLFARFLAENDLLIEPSNRVSVSLGDVEDLARERGVDPWSMAASFAQRMLPQIFRTDDPVLQVALPPETRQALEALVVGLPPAVFTAEDALGWTYQFWQSAEKDAVNARVKSGEKISGETLPAVTQLFTEHYMVQFLLHNTLGAWHAGRVLAAQSDLATRAKDEAELRAAVALPGYEFDYLRFVREDADGPWRPAAGVFASWPKVAKELRVLDPCCGSGHFLVASFELLVALRQREEGLSVPEAVTAVLRDNVFGLELDARCTQIAAFALAMAAWKRIGSPIDLPTLQIACCGIGPSGTKEQWLKLAEQAAAQGGMPVKRGLFQKEESLLSSPIKNALEDLWLLFQKAPELGSLIDPKQTVSRLFQADFSQIEPLFERVLQSEAIGEDAQEQVVAAQGMAKAAAVLGQSFTLVVTNVPYLGRGAQGEVLKAFADQHYPEGRLDLATVFAQRMLGWIGREGTAAMVTPQGWRSLSKYRKLRERLLKERTWDFMAVLGARAFETIGGEVVSVALMAISARAATNRHMMACFEASPGRGVAQKAALLRGELAAPSEETAVGMGDGRAAERAERGGDPPTINAADGSVRLVLQEEQLGNPDAVILTSPLPTHHLLQDNAASYHGISTTDYASFGRLWWELSNVDGGWILQQSTVTQTEVFGGREHALRWDGGSQLQTLRDIGVPVVVTGLEAWGRRGIAVSQMGSIPVTLYEGESFDDNTGVVVPADDRDLPAMWSFARSPAYHELLRTIDQSLKVTYPTLVKVPFDLKHWRCVAAEHYPHGLPEPQTNDPTQWLFHGHPAGMLAAGPTSASPFAIQDSVGHDRHSSLICRTPNAADVLQVATARLLGYRWPAELDTEMRLDVAQRAWAARCDELRPFADSDGIVCLSPTSGEPSAADRIRTLLEKALGSAWSRATERKLLTAAAGADGTASESLEDWLREQFFASHCRLFHDRPFVWHIWDGREDGFHALVNYHRLAGPKGEGLRRLKKLTFTYLNDWIARQRADSKADTEGADGRLDAALRLQGELEKIVAGEPPYDLFIRWKPLHEQPLGWAPDINDGVRFNIRPFVLAADMKQKGAGLLNSKVGVKWTKDRGKEPESLRPRDRFPWCWSCNPDSPSHRQDYVAAKAAEFDGVRWNELHYTRRVKEDARKRHAEGKA